MRSKIKHSLGPFFLSLRNNTGLTQRGLADRFGWATAQMVSNIENGISMPPPSALKTLCKLAKVDYHVVAKQVTEEINEKSAQTVLKNYGL